MKSRKRDTRQGVYLLIVDRKFYVGSTAGGRSRGFTRRRDEHIRDLQAGAHPNTSLQSAWKASRGQSVRFIPLVPISPGNIKLARKIEAALQRAIPGLCNEVKVRDGR